MVCFYTKHIQGTSRTQTLLLPECVDDYVGPDNVVRFSEAFVDSLDLFGRELIAVDGTRLKAVNSGQRNFTKGNLAKTMAESDERLDRYLKQLDDADKDDTTPTRRVNNLEEKIAAIKDRRARLEEHRAELDASGEDQISLTDPDARAMHSSSRIGVGYNIQIAVDTKHKLIAEQQVHNKVSDLGLLTETANAARENLGVDQIDVVADRGYYKIEDIEDCEASGVTPYIPKLLRGSAVKNGFFTKDQFHYDADADVLICPGGQKLEPKYKSKIRDNDAIGFVNTKACRACDLRARCTNAAFRKVTRYAKEAILDRMAARLAANPEVMDQRRESVEHPFGSIKQWMGQRKLLTRRIEKCEGRVQSDSPGLQYPPRLNSGGGHRPHAGHQRLMGACFCQLWPKMASWSRKKAIVPGFWPLKR